MQKRWRMGMSRRAWAATIAVALAAAMTGALVGVVVVNALHSGSLADCPDSYGRPQTSSVSTGPATAGTRLSWAVTCVKQTKIIQLPSNVYVAAIMGDSSYVGDCFLQRCPALPAFLLSTVDGKSEIWVDADLTLWIQTMWKTPQEGIFDWLYEELGVVKGSDREVKIDPRPVRTDVGTATAGTRITVGSGSKERTLQLPPNAYLLGKLSSPEAGRGYCRELRCPRSPAVLLTVDGTKLIVIVDADLTIFMFSVGVPPPEDVSAFDWLYKALGVAKGSEVRVGPPSGWTQ